MFGLLLRAIQAYLRTTFGAAAWGRVLHATGQPPEGFEPMLPYDAALVDRVIDACVAELHRPAAVILEDVGTFLVADPGQQALRRLLHFGGTTFLEFLESLEELPERARLALPDLALPGITLARGDGGVYRLACGRIFPALLPVAVGALRAMADDYGALVLIEAEQGRPARGEGGGLRVRLLETAHGAARRFDLAAKAERRDVG